MVAGFTFWVRRGISRRRVLAKMFCAMEIEMAPPKELKKIVKASVVTLV